MVSEREKMNDTKLEDKLDLILGKVEDSSNEIKNITSIIKNYIIIQKLNKSQPKTLQEIRNARLLDRSSKL